MVNDVEAKDRCSQGAPSIQLTGWMGDTAEEQGSSPHSFDLTRIVAGSSRPDLQDRVITLLEKNMEKTNVAFNPKIVVGLDVSKKHLDVVIHGRRSFRRFENTSEGIEMLINWLTKKEAEFIVSEATGGLEIPALLSMHEAGFLVARVNARWIKNFGRAQGQYAKTDALDARIIAAYGVTMNPKPWTPYDADMQSFKDLSGRRRQLITMRTMEKNRSQQTRSAHVYRQHMQMIDLLCYQIEEIEKVLEQMIDTREDWSRKSEIIRSVPGLSRMSAIGLIADLPELGTCSSKQIAALVGVAPFNHDSGKLKGYRRTGGGRKSIRNILYIVAVGMARGYNPAMQAFYRRMRDAGKPAKVALIAVIRKVVVMLNAMIKKNTLWDDKMDFGQRCL